MRRSFCPLWLIRQSRGLPIVTSLCCKRCQESIPHSTFSIFIRGMNHETCWLIHDKQIMVLINDWYSGMLHCMSMAPLSGKVKVILYFMAIRKYLKRLIGSLPETYQSIQ